MIKCSNGEEGRRSVGSCLPDLRSLSSGDAGVAWPRCVSVQRGAACLVSPPSLPVLVGYDFS